MSASPPRSVGVSVVLSLVICSAAVGQCLEWIERPQQNQQQYVDVGAMAYDTGRGLTTGFSFDGLQSCSPPYPTSPVSWLWNGVRWAQCVSDPGPIMRRDGYAIVYDHARDYVLMIGGVHIGPTGISYPTDETSSWDGAGWTYRAGAPPAAQWGGAAVAYDAARQEVVLFGGWGQGPLSGDTWAWDGGSWIQKFPVTQPPGRAEHAMAYDAARQVVVLFSGRDADGNPLDDTWTWDGTYWTLRNPTSSPPARGLSAMAYDSVRDVTVLFGGYGSDGNLLDDTWEWDGQTWTLQSPSVRPPGREGHSMVFDSRRGKIVLFGDGPSVWEYPQAAHPRILSQSVSQTACLGASVTFAVSVSGDPPLSFQWHRNGVALNLPGAQSPTLTINSADFGSMGAYTCVVSNPCGTTKSTPAQLAICAGVGGCPQPLDVNGDGIVDGADIQRFVEVLLGQ